MAIIFESQCTFWCSVLSDGQRRGRARGSGSAVSMHLLVLSAFRRELRDVTDQPPTVSMYLLVLSAFRLNWKNPLWELSMASLNAPSGAQCFPTLVNSSTPTTMMKRLNAPSGAQCFPTLPRDDWGRVFRVSMHLLVPSAFRPRPDGLSLTIDYSLNAPSGAQCFPT